MARSGPKITSITEARKWLAVYLPDNEKDIPERAVPVICWASLEFDDDPDEVVGQIFDGNCITEVTSVDEEEGFGEFLGYYRSSADAAPDVTAALELRKQEEEEEEEEAGEEGEEEEGEEEEGEEEGEEEEDMDEDDDDDIQDEEEGEGEGEDEGDEEGEDEGDEDDLEDEDG